MFTIWMNSEELSNSLDCSYSEVIKFRVIIGLQSGVRFDALKHNLFSRISSDKYFLIKHNSVTAVGSGHMVSRNTLWKVNELHWRTRNTSRSSFCSVWALADTASNGWSNKALHFQIKIVRLLCCKLVELICTSQWIRPHCFSLLKNSSLQSKLSQINVWIL